jgi:hypothetical protein
LMTVPLTTVTTFENWAKLSVVAPKIIERAKKALRRIDFMG